MTEVMTMRNTVMTGLAGLVFATAAEADTTTTASVQVETFAHTQGVLTETKARGNWATDDVEVGYLGRNRLLVKYDGTVQETLMQEFSLGLPFLDGFRPVGQILLKDMVVAPQAGMLYSHKTDDFSISSCLVWRFQEEPVVEWRTTAAYTYKKMGFEAENFTWFSVSTPTASTGTVRLHVGYNVDRFQFGVASELFYPTGKPVVGGYGRVKF